MKTLDQIERELDSKIPRDVVETRDGGGGRKLSYLPGHYVIDMLNKIFGPLNWAKEVLDVRQIVNTTSRGEFPAYLVKVRLSVIKPDQTVVVKEGYGYGADKSGLNAHELAIKEAVTDAMKVAAKDFGMSLGLALYNPSQENVSDDVEQKPAAISTAPSARPHGSKPDDIRPSKTSESKEDLSAAIKSFFKVAEAQKRLTKEDFRATYLGDLGVSKVDDLPFEAMPIVLAKLKELTK